MCLSWNWSASHRIYCMTIPNCELAIILLNLIENNLRQFQLVSEPKFNCISSKIFWSTSLMRLSRNSMASDRNCSKTIPNCVSVESHLHLIKIILRQFRIVSLSESHCISSNLFFDNSKMCLSRNSFDLHFIENNLRQSILRLGRSSFSSHRNCSKSIPNCAPAESQLHLI